MTQIEQPKPAIDTDGLIHCTTTPDCKCTFVTQHDLFLHNRSGKHGPMWRFKVE